jgi:hypothetical protein
MSHHASGPDVGFPRGDARLDMTDLYAFPKPGDAGKSILILNVHPSVAVNPPGPTTTEPFAPGALYEFKVDTDGDAIADIAYSVQFASTGQGQQIATLRHVRGSRAAAVCNDGDIIAEAAPVSVGRDALVTNAGDAHSTKLEKAGSRQTGVDAHCRRFSSQERPESPISAESRRLMIASLVCSRMNWNMRAAMRRRTLAVSRESCSLTFSSTTLAPRLPFRTTAGR